MPYVNIAASLASKFRTSVPGIAGQVVNYESESIRRAGESGGADKEP